MRSNSPKQTKASRGNGSKSKGPKSKAGKSRAAQNSIKDGVFSRGVVIERLGEKREDFESAKKWFWDFFQPSNSVEQMLVSDFVENWWRRERVRRAEELELQNRLELFQLEDDLRRSDKAERLRLRFAVLFRDYVITTRYGAARHEIPSELQEVRGELLSTGLGIGFLLLLLSITKSSLEETGELSPRQRALLDVISGFGNEGTSAALVTDPVGEHFRTRATEARARKYQTQSRSSSSIDSDTKSQEEVARPPESHDKGHEEVVRLADADDTSKEELAGAVRELTLKHVDIVIDQLNERKRKLQMIQEDERANRMAMAMVDPSTSERFSRAETQAERRMYRALSALAAMRSQNPSDLLPPVKPKLQAKPEQPQSESGT